MNFSFNNNYTIWDLKISIINIAMTTGRMIPSWTNGIDPVIVIKLKNHVGDEAIYIFITSTGSIPLLVDY
jgi:hypothetical protein